MTRLGEIAGKIYDALPQWVKDVFAFLGDFAAGAWDTFWNFVKDPVGTLKAGWEWVTGEIRKLTDAINISIGFVAGKVWEILPDWIKGPINFVADLATKAWTALWNFAKDPVGTLSAGWAWVTETVIGGFRSAWEWLVDHVAKPLQDLWDWILTGLGTVIQTLVNGIGFLSNAVRSAFEGIGETIMGGVTNVLTKGSPREEDYLAAAGFSNALLTRIQDDISMYAASPIDPSKAVIAGGAVLATLTLAQSVGHVLTMVFDATHPIKKWGTQEMFQRIMMNTLSSPVTSGILAAPIAVGILTPMRQFFNARFTPEIPPMSMVVGAMQREVIPQEEFSTLMRYHGFGDDMQDMIVRTSYSLPDISTAMQLRNRGWLTDAEYSSLLKKLALAPEYAQLIGALRMFIPGVTDLVRMAVREALPRYGSEQQMEGLAYWGESVGLSTEWVDAFWKAHWIYPSTEQLFEMLHRGVISRDEAQRRIVLNDISPEWVNRLMSISYSPITRVDLRRLYGAGLISSDRLERGYLDMGYAPDDAKILADFARSLAIAPEKDLTKTEIVKAYREGQIDRDAAVEYLMDLGYDEDEADFIAEIYMKEEEMKERDLTVAANNSLFLTGIINESEYRSRLIGMGYTVAAADQLIRLAKLKLIETPKEVSTGDLRLAYRYRVISDGYLYERLKRRNYTEEDISLIIAIEDTRLRPEEEAA